MTPWMALCSIWKMKRSRKNNSPVVVSMADLAAAMDGALPKLPLLPTLEKEEKGGGGGCGGCGGRRIWGRHEVRGRRWWWMRKGIAGGREKRNGRAYGERGESELEIRYTT